MSVCADASTANGGGFYSCCETIFDCGGNTKSCQCLQEDELASDLFHAQFASTLCVTFVTLLRLKTTVMEIVI